MTHIGEGLCLLDQELLEWRGRSVSPGFLLPDAALQNNTGPQHWEHNLAALALSQLADVYPADLWPATLLRSVFLTFLGELVPKRIAQFNAEGIAKLVARPISLLARLSGPFVYLLTISTDGILRLLGKKELSSANLTQDDIHAMLVEGSQAGLIDQHEHAIVRNVFRLDERQIGSLMTPRSEIVYLDVEQPFESSLRFLSSRTVWR